MKSLMSCAILTVCLFYSINLSARERGFSRQTVKEPDTVLAGNFLEHGRELAEDARYDSSNTYLQKAAAIFEEAALKSDQATLWERYIQCQNLIGHNLTTGGKFEEARFILEQTLIISTKKLGKKHLRTAETNAILGRTFNKIGEGERASLHFQEALTIFRQLPGENHAEVASVYNGLGNAALAIGKFESALDYFQKSLAIRRGVQPADHPDIAASYNNIGTYYYGKGDYRGAIEFMTKSLNIYRRHYETLHENHPHIALNSFNLGYLYFLEGDYGEAENYVNKALGIYRRLFEHPHPEMGQCYNVLGLIQTELGNPAAAIRHHSRAMEIYLQTTGPNSQYTADGHYSLANANMAQPDYGNAISHYLQAIKIYLTISGSSNPLLPTIFNETGIAYAGKRDYEKAIAYHQKVLDLNLGRHHYETGNAYLNLGRVLMKQHKLEEALSCFQKSIFSFAGDFNDPFVYANPSLDEIISAPGLLDALAEKARAFKKSAESDKSTAKLAGNRRAVKNLKASLTAYDIAVNLIDKLRLSFKTEDSKLFLSQQAGEIYQKAIQTALELYSATRKDHYQHQAFTFAEKSRAAVLNEALQESKARKFAGIPEALLEKERSLRIDLAFYDTQIQKLKDGAIDSLRLVEFENLYFDRKIQYDRLITNLERDYPRYFDLKYRTHTASVAEMQNLLDDRTSLIEYLLGNRSFFIFIITKSSFKVKVLPLDASLAEYVLGLRNAIKKIETQNYLKTAAALYNSLIRPVEPLISAYEKLLVIPDGILHYLPVEALIRDGSAAAQPVDFSRLDYVINHYQVSYHYSATLLVNSLTRKRSPYFRQSFAGFAPIFSDEDNNGSIFAGSSVSVNFSNLKDEVRSVTIDGRKFRVLPHSKDEVAAIANAFADKKLPARAYFHHEASELNFKRGIGDAGIVHIATHGVVNEEKPGLSGLIFSQPRDSAGTEDGILYAGETFNLDLNADLIVLSSCESGLGRLVKGEGLMALTRGFLYSGGRNVIVSLWKVYDKHTQKLMVELYRNILSSQESPTKNARQHPNGNSYAQALREAKLNMIANPATAFPKKWSGFVLVGH